LLISFGAYLLLAAALSWPLPARLSTHLPGAPSGDTGVYVWNLWVFQHELLEHARYPLTTSKVLSLPAPRADLSLHNYTTFADLLAVGLVPALGPVRTYNLLYLLFVALNGWCAYLLALEVTGRRLESWLAGALFAASPVLMARSTAHFSLVAAFPLPLVLLAARQGVRSGSLGPALATGGAAALAATCDAYYGVYAALLVGAVLAAHAMSVHCRRVASALWLRLLLDGTLVAVAALAAGIKILGGGTVEILGVPVVLRSLYTPVLLLTVLGIGRIALVWRPSVRVRVGRQEALGLLRFGATSALVACVLLSPMLLALGARLAQGRFDPPATHWRSSPPGADLAAFVMPNPNHAWFGEPFRTWLSRTRADGFPEYAAAIPLVALAVIALAAWRGRARLPRFWVGLTLVFSALAVGPFLHVAGVNTYIPGPWALLRYVPLVGLARSPSRFAVVVTLGVAVLFACALVAMRDRFRRPTLAALVVVAALAFELAPMPRPLALARIPSVYDIVKADPDHEVRVLGLPTGIRDGASSLGDFSAESLYFQTYHEKTLLGGYLSRVSGRRKRNIMSLPVLSALIHLSEGRPLTPMEEYQAWRHRGRFLRRANIGYVVVDARRASPELRQFAEALFELELIAEEDGRVLYRPRTLRLAAGRPPGSIAAPGPTQLRITSGPSLFR
jgi:hypothetical protein